MINGMPIFYSSKTGRELKSIQTKGSGLEPIQSIKGKGTCNKKCNKKRIRRNRLIILK